MKDFDNGCTSNSSSQSQQDEQTFVLSGQQSTGRNLLSQPSVRKLIFKVCRHLLRDVQRATQRRTFVRRIGPELVRELGEAGEAIGYSYEDLIQGAIAMLNTATNGLISNVRVENDQIGFDVLPVSGNNMDIKKFCYKVIKLARQADESSNEDFVLVSSKPLSEVKREDYLNEAPELSPQQADEIARTLLQLPKDIAEQFSQFASVSIAQISNDQQVAIVQLTDPSEYAHLLLAVPFPRLSSNEFAAGLQEAKTVHILKDKRDKLFVEKQFSLFILPALLQRDGSILLFNDYDQQIVEAFKVTNFTLNLSADKSEGLERFIFSNAGQTTPPQGGQVQVRDQTGLWVSVLGGAAAGSLLGFKVNPVKGVTGGIAGSVLGGVFGGVAGFHLYKALSR